MKLLLALCIVLPMFAHAQPGLPQVIPPTPQPATLGPRYDQIQYMRPTSQQNQPNYHSILDEQRQLNNMQNMQIMQDVENYNLQKQREADLKKDLANEPMVKIEMERREKTKRYEAAFNYLQNINPDSFSITDAIYVTENALYNNKYSYNQFRASVKVRADMVRSLLKKEGLPLDNNAALNYGIQQLYKRPLPTGHKDPKTGKELYLPPMRYDFNDYLGHGDKRNVTTTKLMTTATGQCHSMPLLYKMVAEELGAKCWVSYAPEHTYIQFMGTDGELHNFETTNGVIVNNKWMMQSSYVTSAALKNGTYLDTLSNRRQYSEILADLLIYHHNANGWDGLADDIAKQALKYDPNNISLLIGIENMRTAEWKNEMMKVGKIKMKDFPKYPAVQATYEAMKAAQAQVDQVGYQPMPPAAYQQWLKSIEQEKKRRENMEMEAKLQQALLKLKIKKPKVIIIQNRKD